MFTQTRRGTFLLNKHRPPVLFVSPAQKVRTRFGVRRFCYPKAQLFRRQGHSESVPARAGRAQNEARSPGRSPGDVDRRTIYASYDLAAETAGGHGRSIKGYT